MTQKVDITRQDTVKQYNIQSKNTEIEKHKKRIEKTLSIPF